MPRAKVTSRHKEQAAQFREVFLEALRPQIGMPLMLSGGVDSATNLAGFLALGAPPPVCYTFQLGSIVSSDLAVARSMCERFHVKHVVISIPQNEATLIKDIKTVLPLIWRLKKIHIQVTQCFLYLARAAVADDYSCASFAMAADSLWGSARYISAYVKSKGETWCHEARRLDFTYQYASDASTVRVSEACGLKLADPWMNPMVVELLLNMPYADLHTPVKKGLALRAFPEFWHAGKWYRQNSSLQVNSGVREWHDTLLASRKYNPDGARAIIAVYRRMAREMGLTYPNLPNHAADEE